MVRLSVALMLMIQPILFAGVLAQDANAKWLTYRDFSYKFKVRYPRQYVILREPRNPQRESPDLLKRVRFQDRMLAFGDTANLEPPQLTIDVYENTQGLSLRDWVRSKGWLSEDADISVIRLDGAAEGLRLVERSLLAPNEFYYYRTVKHVYKLTPLNQTGQEILSTFQIIS